MHLHLALQLLLCLACSVDAVMESLNSLAVNSLIPHAFNPQQVLSVTRHSFVQDGGKECCREKRTIWRADRKKEGGQFSWGKSRKRNFKTSSVQWKVLTHKKTSVTTLSPFFPLPFLSFFSCRHLFGSLHVSFTAESFYCSWQSNASRKSKLFRID